LQVAIADSHAGEKTQITPTRNPGPRCFRIGVVFRVGSEDATRSKKKQIKEEARETDYRLATIIL
jgi:hypothetical protein